MAISTYLADSIMHYMHGESLNGKTLSDYTDFLGAQFTVDFQRYTVVGIIDCGEIPEKYAPLTQATYYNMETNALASDFNAFIDSGAQRCLFVADGFLQAVKQEKNIVDIYQFAVDAGTYHLVADSRVDRVSEVNRCGTNWQCLNITGRCKAVYTF